MWVCSLLTLSSITNVALFNLDACIPDEVRRLSFSQNKPFKCPLPPPPPPMKKIKQDTEESTSTIQHLQKGICFFSFHRRLFIKPHSAELVSVVDLQTKLRIFRKPINFNSRRHRLIPALMPEKGSSALEQ